MKRAGGEMFRCSGSCRGCGLQDRQIVGGRLSRQADCADRRYVASDRVAVGMAVDELGSGGAAVETATEASVADDMDADRTASGIP